MAGPAVSGRWHGACRQRYDKIDGCPRQNPAYRPDCLETAPPHSGSLREQAMIRRYDATILVFVMPACFFA